MHDTFFNSLIDREGALEKVFPLFQGRIATLPVEATVEGVQHLIYGADIWLPRRTLLNRPVLRGFVTAIALPPNAESLAPGQFVTGRLGRMISPPGLNPPAGKPSYPGDLSSDNAFVVTGLELLSRGYGMSTPAIPLSERVSEEWHILRDMFSQGDPNFCHGPEERGKRVIQIIAGVAIAGGLLFAAVFGALAWSQASLPRLTDQDMRAIEQADGQGLVDPQSRGPSPSLRFRTPPAPIDPL